MTRRTISGIATIGVMVAGVLCAAIWLGGCFERRDVTGPDEARLGWPPQLGPDSHPTGWGQAACVPCHELERIGGHEGFSVEQCAGCHGWNGVGPQTELCVVCHEIPPDEGAHEEHLGGEAAGRVAGGDHGAALLAALHRRIAAGPEDYAACALCHDGAGVGTERHIDGKPDVIFGDGVSGTWLDPTCQVEVCHGSGRPNWESSEELDCEDCHAAGTGAFNDYASGLHLEHLEEAGARCEDCHYEPPSTHHNRRFENPDNIRPDGGVYRDETPDGYAAEGSSGTCADMDLLCHPSGLELPWAADAETCGLCHKVSNDDPPESGAHVLHTGSTGFAFPCDTCHYGVSSGEHPQHNDGTVDVIIDPQYGGSFDGESCSGVSCHGSGSPDWFTDHDLACVDCHEIGGAVVSDPRSGKHAVHDSAGYDCANCHRSAPSTHHNGSMDNPDRIRPDGGTYRDETPNGYAATGSSGTCADMELPCHGGEAPWTTGDACGSCHGATAEDPPDEGSHDYHAGADEAGYPCSTCHYGFSDGSGPEHLNGQADVAFDPTSLAGDNDPSFDGTRCSNV